MTPYYDGMYNSDQLNIRSVKLQLRIYGEDYAGGLVVDAFKEYPNYIAVPRQWARSRGYKGTNRTVLPNYNWPKFNGAYRYNQKECCDKMEQSLIKTAGSLLEAPTGWGKTVASLQIASRFSTPTLILVHKEDLVPQWQRTANELFGATCGRIKADTWDYKDHPVTVAMIQTLRSRGVAEIKDHFGMIIVDEGHHTPCETVSDILGGMNAHFRMGVSATWRRKDGLENLWTWHIGDVGAKGVRPQLPARYYQVPVKQCRLYDRDYVKYGKIQHSNLVTAVAESPEMNDAVRKQVAAARAKNRTILIVTHRLSQVDILVKSIPGAMPYTSKQKPDELDAAKNSDVLVSTFGKVAEGTDIPKLDTLILTTPCSDPEQVYGRVSRDFPGKNMVIVVDLFAPTNYNYAMARKRESRYQKLNIKKG